MFVNVCIVHHVDMLTCWRSHIQLSSRPISGWRIGPSRYLRLSVLLGSYQGFGTEVKNVALGTSCLVVGCDRDSTRVILQRIGSLSPTQVWRSKTRESSLLPDHRSTQPCSGTAQRIATVGLLDLP